MRSLGSQNRVKVKIIVVVMAGNGLGRRLGKFLVLILQLALYILSHSVITISRKVMVPVHGVSSLRLVEINHPYLILFINSIGRWIMDFSRIGETSALSMFYWAAYSGIVPRSGFLLG